MGKKKTETPTYDMAPVLQMQGNYNQEAFDKNLKAARSNQNTPLGSLTWEQDPVTGQWTQNVGLNPQQQDIFNSQQAHQQLLANIAGGALGGYDARQMDFSTLGSMPKLSDYSSLGALPQIGQYSQQATDLYNQLAQPGLDRQRSAKEAQMAAMGLNLGSGRAYDNQQMLLNDSENRSGMMGAQAGISQGNIMYDQALRGRSQGAGELDSQFNQGMQVRRQGEDEMLQQQRANLGQIAGLMGLQQNVGVPSFAGYQTPTISPTNGQAAYNQYYQSAVDAANAKNASSGGLLGGLAGIAGTALGSFAGPMGAALGGALGKSLTGGSGGGSSGSSYAPSYDTWV